MKVLEIVVHMAREKEGQDLRQLTGRLGRTGFGAVSGGRRACLRSETGLREGCASTQQEDTRRKFCTMEAEKQGNGGRT